MPKLNFDDVFLPEKAGVVDKIQALQKQLQVQSIVLTHLMMEMELRTVVVIRKEFMQRMEDEGLVEPLAMIFDGNGEQVRLTMGNANDDNSNSR